MPGEQLPDVVKIHTSENTLLCVKRKIERGCQKKVGINQART